MCDFSLETERSRPAVVGDKLVTHRFNLGTTGFMSTDDDANPKPAAVCLLPGTEIAFAEPVAVSGYGGGFYGRFQQTVYTTAIFRQVDLDNPHKHHDCLEFPTGTTVFLNQLQERQYATVLQLPAPVIEAKAEAKAEEPAELVE